MPKKPPDWLRLDPLIDQLRAEGFNDTQIARELRIPRQTLVDHLRSREPVHLSTSERTGTTEVRQSTSEHQGTLEGHQEVMQDIQQSVPEAPHIGTDAVQSAVQSATELLDEQDVEAHRAVHIPVQPIETGVDDSADDSADESQILFLPPTAVQTAVQKFDTGPVQTLDAGAVQRLDRLEEEVLTLSHAVRSLADRLNHVPVQTPVQITALPPYPKAKADRWNIWLNAVIRDEITAWAAERDISPSQLVQELLWKALNDRKSGQ